MKDNLRSFLENCRVDKGNPFTHTTKSTGELKKGGWSASSYYIKTKLQSTFMKKYCDAVKRGELLTITEKPSHFAPLRVDLDFKSSLDKGGRRRYTPELVKRLVRMYQEEITEIIDPEYFDEKYLYCVVLEKPTPRVEEGKLKDGFHLHFPHFVCKGWIQDVYLRDRVINRMMKEKLWNGIDIETEVTSIIDTNMASKPWMMYGSVNYKGKKSKPYMYNNWKDVEPEKRYGYAFNEKTTTHIHELFLDEMVGREDIKYYLPQLLSVQGYNSPDCEVVLTEKIQNSFKTLEKRKNRWKNKIKSVRSAQQIAEDLATIKNVGLMEMLSAERADEYQTWWDVGHILFNIGQGNEEALDLWKEFSARSERYSEEGCEEYWYKMQLSGKTIASLFYMAKIDSPDEYRAWKDRDINNLIQASLMHKKPVEYDVSRIAVKLFSDRFKCVDSKKNIWYEFRDHRWNLIDDALSLQEVIIQSTRQRYREYSRMLGHNEVNINYDASADDLDEDEKRLMEREKSSISVKKTRCSNIVEEIGKVAFVKKVIHMCKLGMHDEKFMKKIDENKKLLGCKNGVIDLETCTFREGRPDDYITYNMGPAYEKFTMEDEEVKEMLDIFVKMYPNKNRREYFYNFLASILEGGNKNKRFMIFTGPSDGGKSALFTLLGKVFNDEPDGYMGLFPRALLVQNTASSNSGAARPDLCSVRGKRMMTCQELTHRENVNIGTLKELTGNDKIYTRNLYEKAANILPMFTFMMACNNPPRFPGHDEATWKRVRTMDHEAKFVMPFDRKKYPVPDTFEEQLEMKRFHADLNFNEKLDDIAPVFLWFLFERYKYNHEHNKGKFEEPEEVVLSSDRMRQENDIFYQFVKDQIRIVNDKEKARESFILKEEMFNRFDNWYKKTYPSYYRSEKKGITDVTVEVTQRIGTVRHKEDIYGFLPKKNVWRGFEFEGDDASTYNTMMGRNDDDD